MVTKNSIMKVHKLKSDESTCRPAWMSSIEYSTSSGRT